MDLWEILRANSTAPAGSDLWTLINTQNSGTGSGDGDIYLTGGFGIKTSLSETTLTTEIDEQFLVIDVGDKVLIMENEEEEVTTKIVGITI